MSWKEHLPQTRGEYRFDVPLAPVTWFRVGGNAEILYKPADLEDLRHFLTHKPKDMPVFVLGLASNLIVRDAGIEGVVIRLGREFVNVEIVQEKSTAKEVLIKAGAGAPGRNVALFCRDNGLTGPEFLSGIPGSVGGAIAMNGGAYGQETADVLESAELMLPNGTLVSYTPKKLKMKYRECALPEGAIVISAYFYAKPAPKEQVAARIEQIAREREESQPLRTRTGGSTFKNPPGKKAWELIDKAGCRGLKMGDAQISEKHCNFMINTGLATAKELEALGEEVRKRVKEKTGIDLQWEIKRVGN